MGRSKRAQRRSGARARGKAGMGRRAPRSEGRLPEEHFPGKRITYTGDFHDKRVR
jgi:hypothetical protein